MNHARFQRNQKVTVLNGTDVYVVTHPQPDDFNVIGVRNDDDQFHYAWFDQNNLKPLVPNLGLTVEWKIPSPGNFVIQRTTGGTHSIYVVGDVVGEAFVITNITEQDNT